MYVNTHPHTYLKVYLPLDVNHTIEYASTSTTLNKPVYGISLQRPTFASSLASLAASTVSPGSTSLMGNSFNTFLQTNRCNTHTFTKRCQPSLTALLQLSNLSPNAQYRSYRFLDVARPCTGCQEFALDESTFRSQHCHQ